jgi:hypothetical protein
MAAQSNSTHSTQDAPLKKRSKAKMTLWIIGGFFAIIILLLLLLPTCLSTSAGKQMILGKINKSVDWTVEIKELSLGWFSGLKLTGVHFKDKTGNTTFSVDEISGRPSLLSLFRGRIGLTEGLIDKPRVELTVVDKPQSTPAEPAPAESSKSSSGTQGVLPLDKFALELREGNAVIKTGQPPQRLEFKNISTQVNINPAGQVSNLALAMAITGTGEPGNVTVDASVTPQKEMTLEGTSGQMQIEIVNVKLEDFKPLLALAGQKMDIAGLVNAQANVKLTDGQFEKIQADATMENFKQTLDGNTTILEKPIKIQALAAMTDKELKVENLRVDSLIVDSSFCTATCKGDMTSLTYQTKADLAGVQSVASQFTDFGGFSLGGSLNASGTVSMGKDTITAAGVADFANLVVAKGTDKMPATAIKINYDLTRDSEAKLLKAPSVTMVMDAGTIDLKDVSLPLDTQKMTQLSTKADVSLDLQKALAMAKVFAADKLPKDLTLAGALRSQLTVQPKDQDIQFRTDKTEIANLVVGQAGQTPFAQDILTLVADGTVNPKTKNYAVNFNLEGKKAQSLMRFKGNVTQKAQKEQTAMAGDVQADYNWADLTAMARPFLPKGMELEGKRSDKISFSSTYPTAQPDKMKANLNANAALGFQKASLMGLKFGPTELKLDVKQGKAAIDIPDADVSGGKIRFNGDVDLSAKPMKLTLRKPMPVVENVQIDDVISAKLLQYINPMFAKANNVSGVANLSCKVLAIPLSGGSPNDILLDGAIGLTDVKLTSKWFGIIKEALKENGLDLFSIPSTPFTVKDGWVRYTDMPVYFGKTFAIHFLGATGLDKKLDMEIQMPWDGKTVAIPLLGTLDNPKPDISKLVMANIKEQIPIKDEKTKEAVEKGLQILDDLLKKPK